MKVSKKENKNSKPVVDPIQFILKRFTKQV